MLDLPNLYDLVRKLSDEIESAEKFADLSADHLTSPEAAALAANVREGLNMVEPVTKRLKQLNDLIKTDIAPKAFERDDTKTHTNNDGTRVTVSALLYAGIIGGKKEDAFAWLRSNGYPDLIFETVNASSISSLARELAKENDELPDDLFSVYIRLNTSVTNPK